MPVKIPQKYKIQNSHKKFRGLVAFAFALGILVYVISGVYSAYFVPAVVAQSLQVNVEAINTVATYTKAFEEGILQTLSKETLSTVDRASLTTELDQLNSQVVASKNNLNKGNIDDTKEFYDSVLVSFDSFQSLLSSTRSYITFQYCLVDVQSQLNSTRDLKTGILQKFETQSYLYDDPSLYSQLSDLYIIMESTFEVVNTCFDGEFGYLKSVQVQAKLTEFSEYLNQQTTLLQTAITLAEEQNEQGLEQIFQELATNEQGVQSFFDTDQYTLVRYQPLDKISQKNQQLQAQYSQVEEDLDTIKSKYNIL
jgi:hypothetical protein